MKIIKKNQKYTIQLSVGDEILDEFVLETNLEGKTREEIGREMSNAYSNTLIERAKEQHQSLTVGSLNISRIQLKDISTKETLLELEH